MGKNQFVTRRGNDWAVVGANNSKATKLFDTQNEAIKYGREIAKNQESELIIQGMNNKFRQKDSYGSDKYPPEG